MKKISPQKLIVYAINENGEKDVPTKDLIRKTGISRVEVHLNGRHLIARSLVTKRNIQRGNKRTISLWSLNPKRMFKIREMIEEVEEYYRRKKWEEKQNLVI